MLHEILLSLSGHPCPLLRADLPDESSAISGITPPERQLLASAAHLSDIHIKLINHTSKISNAHPSAICRAVATAIKSTHLAAFQRKILQVEENILKDDPELVGAYNIVPLTAVMAEFKQWTRRMEWLWEVAQYMASNVAPGGTLCCASTLMGRLRLELQSGYKDVQETALTLVQAAETTWLRQVSAWVLYGKLPSIGGEDFFIQPTKDEEGYAVVESLVPEFVTMPAASSVLFIGKSIDRIRTRSESKSSFGEANNMKSQLQWLGQLSSPISSPSFAKAIGSIRKSLSETTLQTVLPIGKVIDMVRLLRDFMLLGRGEFAMAISQEADERIRNRWRRAEHLSHQQQDNNDIKGITIRDGEASAVLTRAWASLVSMLSQQSDDDAEMDAARRLLQLRIVKTKQPSLTTGPGLDKAAAALLATSPYNKMLFSVPAALTVQLPTPLDMVISASDLQLYSCINSFLLSLRRAHIRLSDLWKLTSLRRHHPCPQGAGEDAVNLRERWSARTMALRGSWATASAAMFFLGETEAYLQTEIVEGHWRGFYEWLGGDEVGKQKSDSRPGTMSSAHIRSSAVLQQGNQQQVAATIDADIEMIEEVVPLQKPTTVWHDQQTLSSGHTLYLRTLAHRLLLTQATITEPLFKALVHIDYLVSHMRRLHAIFTAIDLETDAGVVDSSTDLEKDEQQVLMQLHSVEKKVKQNIEHVIFALEELSNDADFLAEWEGEDLAQQEEDDLSLGEPYRPSRLGGLDRLLMKLDFGTWFGQKETINQDEMDQDDDDDDD